MGIFSLTTLSTMAEKAVKPYWQDVQVVEVNKEYPRTSFMTYNNRADALSGKFERSKYYRLLNGTWKFYFVDSYKKLPENITDPNTNTDSWDDIQVLLQPYIFLYKSNHITSTFTILKPVKYSLQKFYLSQ